jgi:hypothetical protein
MQYAEVTQICKRKANLTSIHVEVKVQPIMLLDLRICQSEEDDSQGA